MARVIPVEARVVVRAAVTLAATKVVAAEMAPAVVKAAEAKVRAAAKAEIRAAADSHVPVEIITVAAKLAEEAHHDLNEFGAQCTSRFLAR